MMLWDYFFNQTKNKGKKKKIYILRRARQREQENTSGNLKLVSDSG